MTDANSGEVIGEGFNDHFGYVAMDMRQPVGKPEVKPSLHKS
jgi:hypothetical protein